MNPFKIGMVVLVALYDSDAPLLEFLADHGVDITGRLPMEQCQDMLGTLARWKSMTPSEHDMAKKTLLEAALRVQRGADGYEFIPV